MTVVRVVLWLAAPDAALTALAIVLCWVILLCQYRIYLSAKEQR